MTLRRHAMLTSHDGIARPRYSERQFTKDVMELAKLNRWKTAHFKAAIMPSGQWATPIQGDAKGFPDIVLVRDRRFLMVELKMEDGELSDEQMIWMMALQAAGVECDLWTPADWPKIKTILVG